MDWILWTAAEIITEFPLFWLQVLFTIKHHVNGKQVRLANRMGT